MSPFDSNTFLMFVLSSFAGVGLGMAMAKQQQFHSEQRMQMQLLEAQNANKKKPGHAGAFVGSFTSTQHGYGDSHSHGTSSPKQLQNAGALVMHNGGRPPPPQPSERKLL